MSFDLHHQLTRLQREEDLARLLQDYPKLSEISIRRSTIAAIRHSQTFETLSGRGGDTPPSTPVLAPFPSGNPFPTGRSPKVSHGIPHGIEGYINHDCRCFRCSRARAACDRVRTIAARSFAG